MITLQAAYPGAPLREFPSLTLSDACVLAQAMTAVCHGGAEQWARDFGGPPAGEAVVIVSDGTMWCRVVNGMPGPWVPVEDGQA